MAEAEAADLGAALEGRSVGEVGAAGDANRLPSAAVVRQEEAEEGALAAVEEVVEEEAEAGDQIRSLDRCSA